MDTKFFFFLENGINRKRSVHKEIDTDDLTWTSIGGEESSHA